MPVSTPHALLPTKRHTFSILPCTRSPLTTSKCSFTRRPVLSAPLRHSRALFSPISGPTLTHSPSPFLPPCTAIGAELEEWKNQQREKGLDPEQILQLMSQAGPSVGGGARAMEEHFTSHLQLPTKEEMEQMLIERRKQVRTSLLSRASACRPSFRRFPKTHALLRISKLTLFLCSSPSRLFSPLIWTKIKQSSTCLLGFSCASAVSSSRGDHRPPPPPINLQSLHAMLSYVPVAVYLYIVHRTLCYCYTKANDTGTCTYNRGMQAFRMGSRTFGFRTGNSGCGDSARYRKREGDDAWG